MRSRHLIICIFLLMLISSYSVAQEVAPAVKKLKFKTLQLQDEVSPLVELTGIKAMSDKNLLILGEDKLRYSRLLNVNKKAKASVTSSGITYYNRGNTLWFEGKDGNRANLSSTLKAFILSYNVVGLQPYSVSIYTSVLSSEGEKLETLRTVHEMKDLMNSRTRSFSAHAGLGNKSILIAASLVSRNLSDYDDVKTQMVMFEVDFNGHLIGNVQTVALPSSGKDIAIIVQQPVWTLGRWIVPCIYEKKSNSLGDDKGRGVLIISAKRNNKGGLNSGSLATHMYSAFSLGGPENNMYEWQQVILAPVDQTSAPAATTCVMIYETEVANQGKANSVFVVVARRFAVNVDSTGKIIGKSKIIPMNYFNPSNKGTGSIREYWEHLDGPLYTDKGDILIARSLYINTGSDNEANSTVSGSMEVYQIDPLTFKSNVLAKTSSPLPIRFINMHVTRSTKRIWIATEDRFGEVQMASFKSK